MKAGRASKPVFGAEKGAWSVQQKGTPVLRPDALQHFRKTRFSSRA
jgi:hypothetical protein